MSPLANLLTRGREDADASLDISDLPGVRPAQAARVNLLPPEIADAERLRRLQAVCGGAVAAAVVVIAAIAMGASHDVSRAQSAVNVAQARTSVLNAQVAALSDVPQTQQAVTTAEGQRTGALGAEVRWSEYLNNLGLVTPAGIQITGMQVTQAIDQGAAATANAAAPKGIVSTLGTPGIATVTYTGQARSNEAVAFFLDALAAQKGTVDPYFTTAAAGTDAGSGRSVVTFGITATVTADAESGRYSKAGS